MREKQNTGSNRRYQNNSRGTDKIIRSGLRRYRCGAVVEAMESRRMLTATTVPVVPSGVIAAVNTPPA